MHGAEGGRLVFVNRADDLARLRTFVPPACYESSLVVIKGPPGRGKSALTDKLIADLRSEQISLEIAVVDPSIRMRAGTARTHDGFFIQRFAEELSATADGRIHDDFQTFLRNRGVRTVRETNLIDFLRTFPSLGTVYSGFFEVLERFFAQGDYNAEAVLASDSRAAVTLCADYVDSVCRPNAMVVVVREAQQIDIQSLRFLLEMHMRLPMLHLLIEYTTSDGNLAAEHQK